MHGFLKAIGGIIAVLGILVGAGVVIGASNKSSVQLTGMMIGAGLALPGAMPYCFGAIVEHLIAIRRAAEKQLGLMDRQVKIFEKLGQPKA